jgi:hypothetical protein
VRAPSHRSDAAVRKQEPRPVRHNDLGLSGKVTTARGSAAGTFLRVSAPWWARVISRDGQAEAGPPGAGGGMGLLLGGLLTQYASWRACLDVNLVFAAIAGTGAVLLLRQQRDRQQRGLDLPGVLAEGGAMFCIVYGFSNAATHSWQSPDTWGFLAAGSAGLAAFAWWQTRAAYPLLPRGSSWTITVPPILSPVLMAGTSVRALSDAQMR